MDRKGLLLVEHAQPRRAQVEWTKTAIDPLTNSNAIQNLLALVLWALDSERESSVFLDFPKI
jgi:hypothetical protein